MSTMTPNPFGPYATPDELAKGKRKVFVSLAVALLAGALHFAACVSASVRWSRTPEFEAID